MEITAGYFGKRTDFPDFIKSNAGSPEILELDKWLQEGMFAAKQKLKSHWKECYKQNLRYNFFYPFSDTDHVLIGSMFPGKDKYDREFPFILFFLLDKQSSNNLFSFQIPFYFNNSLLTFNDLNENFKDTEFSSLINHNLDVISSIGFQELINSEFQKFITNSKAKDFWERIFGSFNNASKYSLIYNLITFFPLEHNISKYSTGIKIIFNSRSDNNQLDLCYIIKLVMATIHRDINSPGFFWKTESEKVTLNIFLSKPTQHNFMNLLSLEENYSVDLNKTEENNLISEEYKKILENEDLTLNELLSEILNMRSLS